MTVHAAEKTFAQTFGGSIMDDFVVLLCDCRDERMTEYDVVDPREVFVSHDRTARMHAWPALKAMRRWICASVARHGAISRIFVLVAFNDGLLILLCRRSAMHVAPQWFQEIMVDADM